MKSYWINIMDAIWQSTVIFFMSYFAYLNDADIDKLAFGFSIIFCMIITSLIHVLIQVSRIDLSVLASVAFSLLVFLSFTLLFDTTCVYCIPGESPYKVSYNTLCQAQFWFTSVLTIVTAMLPRYTIRCFHQILRNPLKSVI
jgi:hypothetical protein